MQFITKSMYFLHLRRRIISLLLIPLITGIAINAIKNGHYHQLPDGEIVYHSHPYKKDTSSSHSPFQKHHHTPSEYFLFHQITHDPYLPGSILFFLDVDFVDEEIIQPVYLIHCIKSHIYLHSSPRPPPYMAS